MARQQVTLPEGALPDFEGKPVRQCQVKIMKAGDGLSEALAVAPVALHQGEDVYYLLHATVREVRFPKFDTLGDELIRAHVVDTVEIVPVDLDDSGTVGDLLRNGSDSIRRKMEEQYGIQRFPETDPEAEGSDGSDVDET